MKAQLSSLLHPGKDSTTSGHHATHAGTAKADAFEHSLLAAAQGEQPSSSAPPELLEVQAFTGTGETVKPGQLVTQTAHGDPTASLEASIIQQATVKTPAATVQRQAEDPFSRASKALQANAASYAPRARQPVTESPRALFEAQGTAIGGTAASATRRTEQLPTASRTAHVEDSAARVETSVALPRTAAQPHAPDLVEHTSSSLASGTQMNKRAERAATAPSASVLEAALSATSAQPFTPSFGGTTWRTTDAGGSADEGKSASVSQERAPLAVSAHVEKASAPTVFTKFDRVNRAEDGQSHRLEPGATPAAASALEGSATSATDDVTPLAGFTADASSRQPHPAQVAGATPVIAAALERTAVAAVGGQTHLERASASTPAVSAGVGDQPHSPSIPVPFSGVGAQTHLERAVASNQAASAAIGGQTHLERAIASNPATSGAIGGQTHLERAIASNPATPGALGPQNHLERAIASNSAASSGGQPHLERASATATQAPAQASLYASPTKQAEAPAASLASTSKILAARATAAVGPRQVGSLERAARKNPVIAARGQASSSENFTFPSPRTVASARSSSTATTPSSQTAPKLALDALPASRVGVRAASTTTRAPASSHTALADQPASAQGAVEHSGQVHPALPVTRIDTPTENLKSSAKGAAPTQSAAAAKSAATITLESMSSRSKAVQQTQRVSTNAVAPNGSAPARTRAASAQAEAAESKKKPAEKLESLAATPLPTLTASKEPALVFQTADLAPAQVQQAQKIFEPLLPQMLDDASLRVALMPHTARVSLDTPDAGRVSVQLKVTDGIAEVHASGPAAPILEQRQGELRVALAQEGLALGHFDLTQSGTGGQQRGERPDRDEPAAPRRTSSSSSSTEVTLGEGRVHVKA